MGTQWYQALLTSYWTNITALVKALLAIQDDAFFLGLKQLNCSLAAHLKADPVCVLHHLLALALAMASVAACRHLGRAAFNLVLAIPPDLPSAHALRKGQVRRCC